MALRLSLTDGTGIQALQAVFGAFIDTSVAATAADAAAAAASAAAALASQNSATASATSATNSATSATASAASASTSATNAGTSATSASGSASAASTSATNAGTSATNAAASATSASTSATNAANSAAAAAATLANALTKANNLSDVANAATAAHNLGLGTADTPTFTNIKLSSSTAHGVAIGEAGAGLNYVAPNATAGLPLVNNVGADPSYQVLPIAGGGTGANTAAAALAALGTQPTNNPTFTGNVGVPTRTAGDSTANAASTAFIAAALAPMTGKNRFINSNMVIDQIHGGGSNTYSAGTALIFAVDRWWGACTGANVTGQPTAGPAGTPIIYQYTGAAGCTGINYGQRIIAANSKDLAGKTATLSVKLSNSLLTAVTWTAYYANTADTFGTLAAPTKTQIATGTFTVNSTLTRYQAQIAIPASATTGVEVVLSVGAQISGTWGIGEASIESGSIMTTYEYPQYDIELFKCMHYAQVLTWPVNVGVAIGCVQNATTTIAYLFLSIPLRASGTAQNISAGNFNVQTGLGAIGVSSITFTQNAIVFVGSTGSGLTAFQACYVVVTSAGSVTLYLGAEVQ